MLASRGSGHGCSPSLFDVWLVARSSKERSTLQRLLSFLRKLHSVGDCHWCAWTDSGVPTGDGRRGHLTSGVPHRSLVSSCCKLNRVSYRAACSDRVAKSVFCCSSRISSVEALAARPCAERQVRLATRTPPIHPSNNLVCHSTNANSRCVIWEAVSSILRFFAFHFVTAPLKASSARGGGRVDRAFVGGC